MANEVLIKPGTPIVWADVTDYPGAPTDRPVRTHQIDMTGVVNDAARQGAQASLGATHAAKYSGELSMETAVVVTAGLVFEVYFSWSGDPTVGDANPGGNIAGDGITGADAAFTGLNSNLDDTLKLLDGPYVGIATDVSVATKNFLMALRPEIIIPKKLHVSPVIVNRSGQTLAAAGSADQIWLALYPEVTEIQ